ncbi:STAS domain-containing protein [Alkaliphilus pronyensis]|uniref:Anti-sigma factor antagonist n=1 Tax=Alkaliphilus pronyensis TaxID=1482732 RepID=A0A6I0F066_9FIRM|nr:STAS domain-containing protein [Alkaliphilus pronyensis]KAB3533822.1 STAS domain-containing protein [Alkaliphilus pronyensis]
MSLIINKLYDEQQKQWLIELKGEVDIYTSAQLKETLLKLIEEKQETVKIDAKSLDYIDSTGLGVLIGVLKRLKQYDKVLKITNIKPSIKKLLNITGLDKIFVIEG